MTTWQNRVGLVLACALVAGGCTGGSALSSSTTSTVVAATLPSTTTTTLGEFVELSPNGPAFVTEGDRNEYVEALQFLLVCTGHGRIPTGSPDEATFASLARRCGATRTVEFPEDRKDLRIAGNVTPGDDDLLIVAGEAGRTLTVEIVEGAVQFSVRNEEGNILHDARDGSQWSAVISEDGEFRI